MSENLPLLNLIPLPGEDEDQCTIPLPEESEEARNKPEKKRHWRKHDENSTETDEKKKKLDAKTLLRSELQKQRQKVEEESNSGDAGTRMQDGESVQDSIEASSSNSQTIVDELFQDFLAFKMQQDEKVKQLKQQGVKTSDVSHVAHSMEEMSKLLDQEINLLRNTRTAETLDHDEPSHKDKKKRRHSEKKKKDRNREHKKHDRDESNERSSRKERKHKSDQKESRDGDRKKRKESEKSDKREKYFEGRRDRNGDVEREKDGELEREKDYGGTKDQDSDMHRDRDSKEQTVIKSDIEKCQSGHNLLKVDLVAFSTDAHDHTKENDSKTHQAVSDKNNSLKSECSSVDFTTRVERVCSVNDDNTLKTDLTGSLQNSVCSDVVLSDGRKTTDTDSKMSAGLAGNKSDGLFEDGDLSHVQKIHDELDKTGSSVDVQKKPMGLKLAISQESTAWILSGQSHNYKKNKILEEGEVMSSSSNSSSCKDSDSADSDDEVLPDGIPNESGSLSDSDKANKSSKLKKKKKKHKHKKKKKHKSKDKTKKEEKRDKLKRSRSGEKYSKSRSKSPRRVHRSRSHSPVHGSRHRSGDRRRDKYSYDEWDARSYGSKSEHSRGRHRSRSRSQSRERDRWHHHDSRDSREARDLRVKIDKGKLRKIAMANVLKKMQAGEEITGVDTVAMNMIKAGGKSVEELTEYCKKLSERERSTYSSSETDDETRTDSDDDSLIHHPFVIKDPGAVPNIVLNIRNSRQLPVRTPQEKVTESAQLRIQFPVSSGTSHRAKEGEWVPVPKTTAPQTFPAATVTTATVSEIKTAGISPTTSTATPVAVIPAVAPLTAAAATITAAEAAVELAAARPTPIESTDQVFPDPPQKAIDIGSIISERLHAARQLASNPYDVQALTAMHKVQQKASRWAESKYLPGQYIGSTGVQTLTPQELASGDKRSQPWAKKDLFKRAAPVKGGIGMFLLQKMGWKQGEGLGKDGVGNLEPLMLDVKSDRRGLQSLGEGSKKVPPIRMPVATAKDLSGAPWGVRAIVSLKRRGLETVTSDHFGKHPVSALTELCNRRRWGPPNFVCIHESGPDHKKNFLFKVIVNKTEYQPSIASMNKKLAKAQAASACLQELGLIPRT